MTALQVFASLGTAILGFPLAGEARGAAVPLHILPLGDSITQGGPRAGSYRYELWAMLVDEGRDVDFVGSENAVYGGRNPNWPDHAGKTFDRDHEGHWGWTTAEILASDALPRWLEGYTPDVVLIHLGTNDVAHREPPEAIAARLEGIVALLRAKNPRVAIVLAKLIPAAADERLAVAGLNAAIGELGPRLNRPTSPVVVVDQSAGFDPGTDTFDGVHPNAAGEKKMAARWLEGLHRVAGRRPALPDRQPGK